MLALPHRPMSGGTQEGKRPARYHYWRVGEGARGEFPVEFWVARAGEYHGKPGFFYRADTWEQEHWIQVYYFLEGTAEFRIKGMGLTVSPGDMVILPTGIPIESRSEGEILFHWFALEGKWPPVLGATPSVGHFTIGQDAVLIELFTTLRETLITQRPGAVLRAVGIFYTLIARIEELTHRFSNAHPRERHPYPEAVRNAIIFLEEHFQASFDAAQTAAAAGVSASHLRALFEKWLGESPKQFHTRCRIDEAKRLLREQNLSVAEAARSVGFTDRSHFAHVFKEFTGVSPREYG
ncbi:MAG: AraC family transcriptional regulator [Anaerolineales bacterium]